MNPRDCDQFSLRPGPSKDKPITVSIRTRADEEGMRGGVEADVTLAEARAMARYIETACERVENGTWKAGA